MSVHYFCPWCWHEVSSADIPCPACGKSPQADPRDYDDRLIAALRHPHPEVAAQAARVLGMRGCKRAMGPMSVLISDGAEPERLTAVAEALGTLGGDQAVRQLRQLSQHRNVIVRSTALHALDSLGES